MTTHPPFYAPDLADVHDRGYGAHAQHASYFLKLRGLLCKDSPSTLVDLGCGSGILAADFSSTHEVIGVDISQAMIELAQQRAPEANFYNQSFLSFQIPHCHVVTSIGECLNYLADHENNLEQLKCLFQRIAHSLSPSGVFLFDLVEPGLLGPTHQSIRYLESEDWDMVLDYHEDASTQQLTRNITLYHRSEAGYTKSKEVHKLQLYSRETIRLALESVGFTVEFLDCYHPEHPFRPYNVGFLAQKKPDKA